MLKMILYQGLLRASGEDSAGQVEKYMHSKAGGGVYACS